MSREPLGTTIEAAREAVLSVAGSLRNHTDDNDLRRFLTPELITEILDAAWRFQFAEDRGEARRCVREIVSDSLDSTPEGG